ncbi:hypothetical protein DSOL_4128 [Desulfosporosinus metallidurans]|uniref:Uncharacterized protein n=1 Tax=Desulfosporosinus metallidurans TaxID=1888891 RepID=A0A1Q8QLM1_9FIRM|nr:hypothetical protein DSOL_4128 [Desulfosporosinus metallidurans]
MAVKAGIRFRNIPAWLIPIARMDIFQKINETTDGKIAM